MLDKETLSQVSYAISHELLRRMPANKGVEYIRGYSRGSQIAHGVVRNMIDGCGERKGAIGVAHTRCVKHGVMPLVNGVCAGCNPAEPPNGPKSITSAKQQDKSDFEKVLGI